MVYIVCWLFCFGMLFCSIRFPDHARWHCVLAVCAMGLVAILRGTVGTDTVAYAQQSALVRSSGFFVPGIEPLFGGLLKILQQTGWTDTGVVRLVSVVDVGLLLVYIRRSVFNERYLLLSAILPAFFYEYTMNALRIGLASVLFLLAMQDLSRRHKLGAPSVLLSIGACLTHYSALLYPIFFLAVLRRWSMRLLLGGVIVGVLALVVFFLVHPPYLMAKLQSYVGFRAPSRLSGLSSVVQIVLVLFAAWKSTLSHSMKLQLITVALVVAGGFLGVVQFSYAGLRLLELIVFLTPVVFVCAHELENKPMNGPARFGLLAFGTISAVFIFRRFLVESPDSLAPFLPYHLIFS